LESLLNLQYFPSETKCASHKACFLTLAEQLKPWEEMGCFISADDIVSFAGSKEISLMTNCEL
jgi:hypothetical protein